MDSKEEEKTPYQEVKEILEKSEIPLCELSIIHNNILLMLRIKDVDHLKEVQRLRNELNLIEAIADFKTIKLKKRLWLLSTFYIITIASCSVTFFYVAG